MGIYCLPGKLTVIWNFTSVKLGQIDRSEICIEVSFTSPEVMWTLIMKLPYTEVKFYPEVKFQTGMSSLRVSCKCALRRYQGVLGMEFRITWLLSKINTGWLDFLILQEKITSWACLEGSWLKLFFPWYVQLLIFNRSLFKALADKLLSRTTEKKRKCHLMIIHLTNH